MSESSHDNNKYFSLFEEYRNQNQQLPSLATHYILKKIMALESIFCIPGVKSIEINSDFSITNESDSSVNFLPNVFIENFYNIDTDIDNKSEDYIKYEEAFKHLKKIDEEICEYISEEAGSDRNSIENKIITLNDVFLNTNVEITKDNRFNHYMSVAPVYFSKDLISDFTLFLDFLKEGKEYQKTGKSYGEDFDYFPYNDESWAKIEKVKKAKHNFLFNYSMILILESIIDHSTEKNTDTFVHIIVSLSDNKNPIHIKHYENREKFRKEQLQTALSYKANNKEHFLHIDFSDTDPIEELKNIINTMYEILRPSDFYSPLYSERIKNTEKLFNQYYSQYESKMIKFNLEDKSETQLTKQKRI